jgi:hypothetical protein
VPVKRRDRREQISGDKPLPPLRQNNTMDGEGRREVLVENGGDESGEVEWKLLQSLLLSLLSSNNSSRREE